MYRFYPTVRMATLAAVLLSAVGLSQGATAASSHAALPPVAPVQPIVDTLHGVRVADPYRAMENLKDPAVRDWFKGQGEFARSQLDRLAGRDALEKRITELTSASGDAIGGIRRLANGQLFYLKRPKGERQFRLVVRDGLAGAERVLKDPEVEARATGVPHAINYFVPAWDGRHVAYGISAGGSEDASLHVLDVATGQDVGGVFPRVHEAHVSWLPDSQSFTFNQLKAPKPGEPETEAYMDSRVLWARVGAAAEQAVPVFGPTVTRNLGMGRLDVAALHCAPDSPWVIARTTDTTLPEGFLFVGRVADLGKPGMRWTRIAGYADQIVEIDLRGDHLYYMTYAGAPRKKVMRLDLNQPQLTRAQLAAAAPADGVLEDFSLNQDALIASVRQGTDVVLRRYANGDTQGTALALPGKGAARVAHDAAHAHTDVLYTFSGWMQMPLVYRWDGKASTDTGLRVNPPLAQVPEVEIVDVQVPSHDGVKVPMTLIYKKGLQRDGTNPTLLSAYGAYGFSETASFLGGRLAWIERGGVLALANVRGSGVHGHDWYLAGKKATKSNTWKDGVAAAQYLIAQGYASAKTLGIMGTSAGGIFVGRAVTTAPQLFAAAIFDVGVMDAVRAEDSANGITNISEFGSYRNRKEFPALLEMSTYHQIRDGVAYPGVLLVQGMNDPRVDAWHAGKAAARLQAASSSGKPVLLRLDMQAGHGMGSTANQRNAMAADIYSFLLWQMGKVVQKPEPTQGEIIQQSQPSDWRALDADNTVVMEIQGQTVVMELAPRFAPQHVANIKTLAREGYYTGSAVVRVQDNYVTQWADPADDDKPESKAKQKTLGSALAKLPAEYTTAYQGLPISRFADADGWAPESGFVDGFPVAADPKANQAWLAHCYGMVGAARASAPDSSTGTSLYTIIGQAPRALDRNITVVGRIVKGMEVLSSLPRGPAPMGFYAAPQQPIPITRARLLADIPAAERPALEVLRTDTATWSALVEASRHARGGWAVHSPLHSNICNRSVPTRVPHVQPKA
jgi:prolyl oligopeptidase